jgi:predicted dehydrogenase
MKRTSSKARFRVAVLGAGAISPDHIGGFQQHPAATVAAICDISQERGREAAARFGVSELVEDYRLLLARPDIDIISIALPNYLHAPVALAALRAGKHVMLDKPMTTSAADAARLVREAKRRGLLLMVGQSHRFMPEVQTARQLVMEGAIGEVYHAKTSISFRRGIPRIGSWFTQGKYAGGGCLYDIGVHALDRGLFLMGEFDAVSVSGQTWSQLGPRGHGNAGWGRSEIDPGKPFDVEDLAVALIKLKSGRTVLLEVSWAAWQVEPLVNSAQLFGTEGGLSVPPLKLVRPARRGYAVEDIDPSPALADPNRMVHFVDCLLGKAVPLVKPEESLAVQRILDAIYRSAATGREVRLKS